MKYKHEATSREGLVQQVAVSYVKNGYFFYVKGKVPPGKDPRETDRKLLKLYGIKASKHVRYRRKKEGLANLQYIRFGSDWVLLATKGRHELFFEREAKNIRDLRKAPLTIFGYSITYRAGGWLKKEPGAPAKRDQKERVRVQISKARFQELRVEFLTHARNRSEDWYRMRFYHVGFEPYAPIRKQLLELLRQVNKARGAHGLGKIAPDCIRYRRRILKPFELEEPVNKAA